MSPTERYEPPEATDIARAQSSGANLTLLSAQRRFYARAKIWATARGLGVGTVAIAAPILAAFWGSATAPAATIAAIWYVLDRVLFLFLERQDAARGATVQEQLDTTIFGMPTIAVRKPRVLPEDIFRITSGGLSRCRQSDVERPTGRDSMRCGERLRAPGAEFRPNPYAPTPNQITT